MRPERLAAAAGGSLGPVVKLSTPTKSAELGVSADDDADPDDGAEAVAPLGGTPTFRAAVVATFELRPGK